MKPWCPCGGKRSAFLSLSSRERRRCGFDELGRSLSALAAFMTYALVVKLAGSSGVFGVFFFLLFST